MSNMNELKFSTLYYTVARMARVKLQTAQNKLVRDLRLFALANNAVPTIDTALYSVAYSREVNDFIVVTNGTLFNPNVVYFSDRKVAIRAIFAYGDDMEHILELTDIVGKLGTATAMDEDNSPFTQLELVNLYDKLVDFGE